MILGILWSFLDRALCFIIFSSDESPTPTCSWYLPWKQWLGHGKNIALGVYTVYLDLLFLLSEGAGATTAGWDMNMFLPHEMCKICQQHVQNPGIITLREGDFLNSILRRWGRGFFRCSDCYFNDGCSKQKCCVDLLKCNVKYATVTRGLAIWNDYINSRNTGKRLPVFHSHGFHTAIFMDEEQIWTPQLFITDQPLWSADFFSLVPCLRLV